MARRHSSRPPRIKTPASAQRWIISSGQNLDDSLRTQILALGNAVVPALIELLDEAYWSQDAQGGGHAPIHAARLLRELNAEPATSALLDAYIQLKASDILFSDIEEALTSLGTSAVEPLLARLEDDLPEERRAYMLNVLARAGGGDERITPLLIAALPDHPVILAGAAAIHGDPALLPHLSKALDRTPLPPPDPSTFFATFVQRQNIIELTGAIETLGGTLTPSQRARKEILAVHIDSWRRQMGIPDFNLDDLRKD